MACTPSSSGLVFFPALHPALTSAALPEAVRFFNPGLAPEDDPRWWHPDDLPLGNRELVGFVREFERLKREIKNPKELAMLAESSNGHFFAATSFAVREELEDQLHPERVATRRQTAAQLTLCVAWMVEENLLDLAATGDIEGQFHRAMAESLGIGIDGDEDAADLAAVLPGAVTLPSTSALVEEFGIPWRRLLSPFWAVLPETVGLCVADADIMGEWLEAGVAFTEPTAGMLAALFGETPPTGTVLTARETGWRLLGKTRPKSEAPWLDTPRTVCILQP